MSKKIIQVPFDSHGNMNSYPERGSILKDNFVFEETMTYYSYSTGRSSVTVEWKDSKGRTYSMFMTEFDSLIRTKRLSGDSIKGKWTFRKQGSNCSLVLIG